ACGSAPTTRASATPVHPVSRVTWVSDALGGNVSQAFQSTLFHVKPMRLSYAVFPVLSVSLWCWLGEACVSRESSLVIALPRSSASPACVSRESLLTNAEGGENRVEQVLHVDLSMDTPKRLGCDAQMLRPQLDIALFRKRRVQALHGVP